MFRCASSDQQWHRTCSRAAVEIANKNEITPTELESRSQAEARRVSIYAVNDSQIEGGIHEGFTTSCGPALQFALHLFCVRCCGAEAGNSRLSLVEDSFVASRSRQHRVF